MPFVWSWVISYVALLATLAYGARADGEASRFGSAAAA